MTKKETYYGSYGCSIGLEHDTGDVKVSIPAGQMNSQIMKPSDLRKVADLAEKLIERCAKPDHWVWSLYGYDVYHSGSGAYLWVQQGSAPFVGIGTSYTEQPSVASVSTEAAQRMIEALIVED